MDTQDFLLDILDDNTMTSEHLFVLAMESREENPSLPEVTLDDCIEAIQARTDARQEERDYNETMASLRRELGPLRHDHGR